MKTLCGVRLQPSNKMHFWLLQHQFFKNCNMIFVSASFKYEIITYHLFFYSKTFRGVKMAIFLCFSTTTAASCRKINGFPEVFFYCFYRYNFFSLLLVLFKYNWYTQNKIASSDRPGELYYNIFSSSDHRD